MPTLLTPERATTIRETTSGGGLVYNSRDDRFVSSEDAAAGNWTNYIPDDDPRVVAMREQLDATGFNATSDDERRYGDTYEHNRNLLNPAAPTEPTAADSTIAQAEADAARIREQQQQHINRLTGQLDGNAPSVAELQLRRGLNQATAQQYAMANSARGYDPALAQRGAANNAALIAGQGNEAAALLRASESAQIRGELATALGMTRGQDLEGGGLGVQMRGQDIQMQMARLQAEMQKYGIDAQKQAQMMNFFSQLFGAGVGALGAGMATSDRRAKKEVRGAKRDTADFLKALKSYRYKYKNAKADGEGEHFGIMAQDLEKSRVGRSMVVEIAGKKMVDTRRGFGAVLAATAEMNRRLEKLEKSRAGS